MKTVGKRTAPEGWEAFNQLQKLAMELRKGQPFIPKGVYRFKTFEEAQQWSLKMMSRPNRGSRR